TWLPLGIMSALLLAAMAFVLQENHQAQLRNTREGLAEVVKYAGPFIAQEIYLGQLEGLKLRIDEILSGWKQKNAGTQACLLFVIRQPGGKSAEVGACAYPADPKGILEGQYSPESTQIRVGN